LTSDDAYACHHFFFSGSFYVGATYNVSRIIETQPNSTGMLYAAGTFLPVMGFWMEKNYYDGRFVVEDDVYHRAFLMAVLVVLATAVLHIRPVDVMENSSEQISMFVFSLCLVLERLLAIANYIELYLFGIGQKVLKTVARKVVMRISFAVLFYVAAMIVAAMEYFGNGVVGSRRLAAAAGNSKAGNTTNGYGTGSTYGGDGYNPDVTNVPIYLCLFGYLANMLYLTISVMFLYPSGGRHKEM
jgi:hypothetical protein